MKMLLNYMILHLNYEDDYPEYIQPSYEAKLALPMSGYGTVERFPTIEEKAAVYYFELASGHCFNDGNKRTAYLTAFVFLDINGYDLVVDDITMYEFTIMIANDKTRPPLEVVSKWIKEHMHKR